MSITGACDSVGVGTLFERRAAAPSGLSHVGRSHQDGHDLRGECCSRARRPAAAESGDPAGLTGETEFFRIGLRLPPERFQPLGDIME